MRNRNSMLFAALITLPILLLIVGVILQPGAEWSGVDETVIELFAEEAGRPAREPFINTDQGDLLLLLFLMGGASAGFIAGYSFRRLFPSGSER